MAPSVCGKGKNPPYDIWGKFDLLVRILLVANNGPFFRLSVVPWTNTYRGTKFSSFPYLDGRNLYVWGEIINIIKILFGVNE